MPVAAKSGEEFAVDVAPTQEMLAQWAAEELWDWRVRVVFACVCAVAALACIAVYVAFGRNRADAGSPLARRWFGRIAVTLLVVGVAESAFFKDDLTTAVIMATALIIGLAGLRMPGEGESEPSGEGEGEGAPPGESAPPGGDEGESEPPGEGASSGEVDVQAESESLGEVKTTNGAQLAPDEGTVAENAQPASDEGALAESAQAAQGEGAPTDNAQSGRTEGEMPEDQDLPGNSTGGTA